MLSEIRVENFKCFGNEVAMPCRRLNLLTGGNSNGKTTLLQALLLVHQTVELARRRGGWLMEVPLNGPQVRLGNYREVQHSGRPQADPIQISFEFTPRPGARPEAPAMTTTQLWLSGDQGSDRELNIKRCAVHSISPATGAVSFHEDREVRKGEDSISLWLKRPKEPLGEQSQLLSLASLRHVSADRLGPQDIYPRKDLVLEHYSVGPRGEGTAEVLQEAAAANVKPELCRPEVESQTLPDQAAAWLSYVFGGGSVRLRGLDPDLPVVQPEMNIDGSAVYYRPVHVGFGYSYVLPILVEGLLAGSNFGNVSKLVVENPEAHLHPAAQSRMGEFLANVMQTEVQVFVETHSEHVLNACRLGVREGKLPPEELNVLYFRRDSVDPILRIEVDKDGMIRDWPDGFFDQRTHEFIRLFGI